MRVECAFTIRSIIVTILAVTKVSCLFQVLSIQVPLYQRLDGHVKSHQAYCLTCHVFVVTGQTFVQGVNSKCHGIVLTCIANVVPHVKMIKILPF